MKPQYAEGLYWGKVVAQQMGESKEKKTPQFVLTFAVLGAVDRADPEGALLRCPQGNRSVFRYFTDGTIDYVVEDIRILCAAKGIEHALPSFRHLDPNTEGFFDFTGAELAFYCKHEDYQGEAKERWSISRGSGKPQCDPLDDRGMKALDSLFGKKLKETKADPKSKSAAAPEVAPPTEEDLRPTRREHFENVKRETVAAHERDPADIPF